MLLISLRNYSFLGLFLLINYGLQKSIKKLKILIANIFVKYNLCRISNLSRNKSLNVEKPMIIVDILDLFKGTFGVRLCL